MSDNHEHEHGITERACPEHDENMHWLDDEAYIADAMGKVPDNPPTWDEMVSKLGQFNPPGSPAIYRFALVYVDGKTGLMNVVTSPHQSHYQAINLLTRAAGIMAFQEHQNDLARSQEMRDGLARMFGQAQSMPMDDDDIGGGPYL